MANFPANRRSSNLGQGFLIGIGCFVVGLILISWCIAIGMLVHGTFTKDLWEVITGGVMIVVLLIIRVLTGGSKKS